MLQKRILVGLALAASTVAVVTGHLASAPDPQPMPLIDGFDGTSQGSLSMDASLSHLVIGTDADVWASIEINASGDRVQSRVPMDVALVIDQSGSMDGEKLAAAKRAANALTARMSEDDRLAIISFSGEAQVKRELGHVTFVNKSEVYMAIDQLHAYGGTNIGAAYDEAARVLSADSRGAARVMFLISDGHPTVGDTDMGPLDRRATQGFQSAGITTTTLGIGDDFDESVMGAMAVKGGGHFYYVADAAGLERDLNAEWEGLAQATGRQVQVRLTPPAGVVIRQVPGFSTRQDGESTVVHVDTMFANSRRILMVQLDATQRLSGADALLDVDLSYEDLTAEPRVERRIRATLAAVSVDRTSNPDDVRLSALSQARRVSTAVALAEADRLWGSNRVAEGLALLQRERVLNDEFVRRYGESEGLTLVNREIERSQEQMSTLVVQEKRSIRIRKKRKVDTIEIIVGDH